MEILFLSPSLPTNKHVSGDNDHDDNGNSHDHDDNDNYHDHGDNDNYHDDDNVHDDHKSRWLALPTINRGSNVRPALQSSSTFFKSCLDQTSIGNARYIFWPGQWLDSKPVCVIFLFLCIPVFFAGGNARRRRQSTGSQKWVCLCFDHWCGVFRLELFQSKVLFFLCASFHIERRPKISDQQIFWVIITWWTFLIKLFVETVLFSYHGTTYICIQICFLFCVADFSFVHGSYLWGKFKKRPHYTRKKIITPWTLHKASMFFKCLRKPKCM